MAITNGTSPKREYTVFTRNWWRSNPACPDGREPGPGPRHRIGYADTEREAREMCAKWNANHKPGKLSKKAEYTETYSF